MALTSGQKFKKVISDVWPKLLIFTIMIVIVVFQKLPQKLKALGFSDQQIKEQFESGEFQTTEVEEGPIRDEAIRNFKLTALLVVIYLIIRWINNKQEDRDDAILLKEKLAKEEEAYVYDVDQNVDTYQKAKKLKQLKEQEKDKSNSAQTKNKKKRE